MAITLCHSDEIPEDDARGFDLPQGKLFAVKKKGKVYLYLNCCPHLNLPLEWEPHAFLDSEALYIKCSNHGAMFIPESGECIQGPCLGDALWSIAFQSEDGHILISEEELPEPA